MPCHPNSYLLSRYLLFVTLNMRLEEKYLSIRGCTFPVEEEQMTSISNSHPQGLLEGVLRVRRRVTARQGLEASDIYLSLCLYIFLGNGYHRA